MATMHPGVNPLHMDSLWTDWSSHETFALCSATSPPSVLTFLGRPRFS